jgi:murein DD-endopeptidase MepM/ murein hydrolase activator NlpD
MGALGLLKPHRPALALAPPTGSSAAQVEYPPGGAVAIETNVVIAEACTGTRPPAGSARVEGLSLFGGAVTAQSVTLNVTGESAIDGLRVDGRSATLEPGQTIRLGDWGYLLAPDTSSPSRGALELELSADHAGLPAGTIVLVPYALIPLAQLAPIPIVPPAEARSQTTSGRPKAGGPASAAEQTGSRRAAARPQAPKRTAQRPARKRSQARPAKDLPLKETPPLHGGPYTFPVTGSDVIYGDTYGALRSDVPGGWHHGDDIFAALGTPVVAVADGTLNRVGWERLGGWRLWVRDRDGDEFYYAHLSGYSTLALRDGRVRRGQVIGFIGNTGDAFTTLPHLHFEIHPRSLLHLKYDGAVDPTSYLRSWQPVRLVAAPRPVHPKLPRAVWPRHEAVQNFRELLAARGQTRHKARPNVAPAPIIPGVVDRPRAPVAKAVSPSAKTSSGSLAPWIAGVAALAMLVLGLAILDERDRRAKRAQVNDRFG